jgi:DNA-binding NtrC family response regulator
MSAPSSPPAPRPAVLLVDDEPPLLEALRLGLMKEFDVELANNAEEAELMLASRAFDVVVSDHLMPGEEGLHFLVGVSERHPRTHRILLTGYMNPELISRIVTVAKLAACLVKPVKAEQLAKVIRAALAG